MKLAARFYLLALTMIALLGLTLVGSQTANAATTGTITGTIQRPDGSAVEGADIDLYTISSESAIATTTTNSKGEYTFAGITPGTYTAKIGAPGFESISSPIVVTQDYTSTLDITLEPKRIGNKTRIIPNQIRRTDPSTQYNISSKTEQETKSQPNNLYQFPGLLFGQPGVTPDPSGYVHIRGSDFNQVGFDVDGVQITEPMTNSFATNLVTVGLKSANLFTGGADASYGNATGGYINEITQNGRDFATATKKNGGVIEGTFGPGHGWKYTGTNSQFGGITDNNKFDYYFSTIAFKNKFPGNTQIASLNSSIDGVGKFNYYADKNNTFTGFFSHGFEQYDDYLVPNGSASQNLKYNPVPSPLGYAGGQDYGSVQVPHDDQGYDFSYLSYKHNFNSSSVLTYRFYRIYNYVIFNEASLNGVYESRHSVQIGNQLDYSNIFSPTNTLKAGLSINPSTTQYHVVGGITAPLGTGQNQVEGYIEDLTSKIKPTQTTLYATDQIKSQNQKIALSLGARYSQQKYDLNNGSGAYSSANNPLGLTGSGGNTPGNYTASYTDPRIGLTYSPSNSFVIRSSASTQSQFADTILVERLTPLQAGIPFSNISSTAQQSILHGRYYNFNKLEPSHANNYDIGFQKSFTIGQPSLKGAYDLALTAFQRKQYDLIQYSRLSYNPLGGARGYDNSGHGHASGVEALFTKRALKQSDFNGYVGYTNQVAKATNSDFDTGYQPYFYFYNSGNPFISDSQFRELNNTEVEPSYNQRHTIGLVLNKRVTKLVEESAFLDAGSGFPFAGGAASNGYFGGADAQHGEFLTGTADFSEVPVVLPGGVLQPAGSTVIGHSGWHYKITLNTSFYLTENTSLFFNVDNIFDRSTVLTYATSTQAGQPYYYKPSAKYPQGLEYFGPSTILTPVFVTFGFRSKF